jgi:hypothetical protein
MIEDKPTPPERDRIDAVCERLDAVDDTIDEISERVDAMHERLQKLEVVYAALMLTGAKGPSPTRPASPTASAQGIVVDPQQALIDARASERARAAQLAANDRARTGR